MDPILAALGGIAQELAIELAVALASRRRRGRGEISHRRAERALAGTADRLSAALRDEMARMPDHEWQAAVFAARITLKASLPIAVDDVLAADLEPDLLVAHVRHRAARLEPEVGLGDDARNAYLRILVATCTEIVDAVVALPEFLPEAQRDTLRRMRDVQRKVDELSGDRRRRGGDGRDAGHGGTGDAGGDPVLADHERFEVRYLRHVVATLGRLELFGLRRGRAPRTHAFEDAYVQLAVARSGGRLLPDEDDDDLTGAGVDVDSAFRDQRRVLVRGGAGAGKTTLLRWLAVEAGQATLAGGAGSEGPATGSSTGADRTDGADGADGTDGGGERVVPFFVPLRQFTTRDFPAPEALPAATASVIAAEMPDGWAAEVFRAGRALVLVDGVDELEPARRLEARQWIDHLITAYPGIRLVVSARPFAIAEDWLTESGFVTFDLLPLSPMGIQAFLAAWHDAARDEHPDDPEMRAWLDACESGLDRQLSARRELRRLAGSPLLCGLLCALHQDRNMHLPRDRKGLYDAALDLLLVRWDEARGVRVDELPLLSKEEQLVLLQRFAYSMVRNHEVVVDREVAARRIGHAMRGLRSHSHDLGAGPVLQRTLERTGLLREPQPDEVQFVHRTFRDYLAAKEVVDCSDLGLLVDHAHLDQWHDVVVNAVALARPRERDQLLRHLLDGNRAALDDPRVRNRLRLVAAACLEHADVLDSDEVREMVEQAAAELIPPATLDEADVLARAGAFVLDLLPGPEGLTPDQAACVVRTAAMIGAEGVRDKLTEFVGIGESRVIDELLRAWRRSDDPEGYARNVLADVDFGDRTLEVRGWHRVRCLPHLNRLTSVTCYGDFSPLDSVALVPHLRRLELVQNEVVRDLSPLARSTSLRVLLLTTGCQFLRDLSPLALTGVEELGLHLVAADLTSLRSPRLRRLVVRDSRLSAGLSSLSADLPLRELVIDNLPRARNLMGVDRWPTLEHVTVRGTPGPAEVDALAGLPRLRTLVLVDPAGVDDRLALAESLPGVTIG